MLASGSANTVKQDHGHERRLSGRPLRRSLRLRQVDEESQRSVDGHRVGEYLGDIGVKEHNIRPGLVGFVMLASDAPGKVVLRSHVAIVGVLLLIHGLFVLTNVPT